MSNTITLTATDGSTVNFVDDVIGSGTMKDVYFSPDKSYVVQFYRKPVDPSGKDRLKNIVGVYRERIFNQPGGAYWKDVFCWPTHLVEWQGKTGLVCPAYPRHFYFGGKSKFAGKEKEGKWFASSKLRNRFLSAEERGTWLTHMQLCLQIARGVRRLHAAGLAHSDLSYKNVLVDPESGRAAIIDIDGLVVPGKFPPDVVGTPDFIAPEVMETRSLKLGDPQKRLPNVQTDRHALAVLIYMYLLNRHPLRGGKVHNIDDPNRDEELSMGEKALFIEHPQDASNRPKLDQVDKWELPQADISRRPYTLCGPYLKELFDRAFIDGLHDPGKRPSANDWEMAIIKTMDLMQPCANPDCEAHWFAFDNTLRPRCPFCGREFHGQLPVLNLYSSHRQGSFTPENRRLMVYNKQTLYRWHANSLVSPNEKISDDDKKPVGDFHFIQNRWILINRRLRNMYDADTKRRIEIGQYVELKDGKRILFDKEQGGRLAVVQLIRN